MNEFYKKIESYINKYSQTPEVAPHFKYKETTYIEPQVVFEIYSLIKQRNSLQSMWEKECDYNRLLRNENSDLRNELEYLYQDDYEEYCDEHNESNNNKEPLC